MPSPLPKQDPAKCRRCLHVLKSIHHSNSRCAAYALRLVLCDAIQLQVDLLAQVVEHLKGCRVFAPTFFAVAGLYNATEQMLLTTHDLAGFTEG